MLFLMFEFYCYFCSIIFNNVNKEYWCSRKNEFVNDIYLCEFNEGLNICCYLNFKLDCC